MDSRFSKAPNSTGYSAYASDLCFPPGKWPQVFIDSEGTVWSYQCTMRESGGDVLWASYDSAPMGSFRSTLTVFND